MVARPQGVKPMISVPSSLQENTDNLPFSLRAAHVARHTGLAGHCYRSPRFGTRCPRYLSNSCCVRPLKHQTVTVRPQLCQGRSLSVGQSSALVLIEEPLQAAFLGRCRASPQDAPQFVIAEIFHGFEICPVLGGTFSREGVAPRTMFTKAFSIDWFIPLAARRTRS